MPRPRGLSQGYIAMKNEAFARLLPAKPERMSLTAA
jgi:hypothetical protein